MQANAKDPLLKTSVDSQRALFERFGQFSEGFPREDVVGASLNIIINALRQAHPTRAGAEKAFDEIFGQTKQLLVDHYDGLGRKRGVFPYDQVISMPLLNARPTFLGRKQ